MRTHCRLGQELLNTETFAQTNSFATIDLPLNEIFHKDRNPFLHMAAEIAGFHHEQWNGGGYPHGKKQAGIPLPARIVTISDVYDALRNKRTYKPEIPHDETIAIMRKESAFRFDPDIFSVFEKSLSDFQDIHHQYGDGCA